MAPEPDAHVYPGPPTAGPPSPHWHPPLQPVVAAARRLPAVDDDAMDTAERDAARITYAIGLAALTVLMVIACSRVI